MPLHLEMLLAAAILQIKTCFLSQRDCCWKIWCVPFSRHWGFLFSLEVRPKDPLGALRGCMYDVKQITSACCFLWLSPCLRVGAWTTCLLKSRFAARLEYLPKCKHEWPWDLELLFKEPGKDKVSAGMWAVAVQSGVSRREAPSELFVARALGSCWTC